MVAIYNTRLAVTEAELQAYKESCPPHLLDFIDPDTPAPNDEVFKTLTEAQKQHREAMANAVGRANESGSLPPFTDKIRWQIIGKDERPTRLGFFKAESDEQLVGVETEVVHRAPRRYLTVAVNDFLESQDVKINREATKSAISYNDKEKREALDIGGKIRVMRMYFKYLLQYKGIPMELMYHHYSQGRQEDQVIDVSIKENEETMPLIHAALDRLGDEAERLFLENVHGKIIGPDFQVIASEDLNTGSEGLILLPEDRDSVFHPLDLFYQGDPRVKSRTIVLHGKPGTGKTLCAMEMIKRRPANATAIFARADAINQAETVFELFHFSRLLAQKGPCVVVIDDSEHLLQGRQEGYGADKTRAMMAQLQENSLNEGLFFILTTNYPDKLDDALVSRPGRINQFTHFPAPTADMRHQFLSQWLLAHDATLSHAHIEEAVALTEGHTLDVVRGALEEWNTYDRKMDCFVRSIKRFAPQMKDPPHSTTEP